MITKKFVVTSTTYYGNGSNLKTPIEDNWTCMIAGLPTTQHVAHNTLIPCPQHVAHNTLPTTRYPQQVTHNTLPTTCYPQHVTHNTFTRCPQHVAHNTLIPCPQHVTHNALSCTDFRPGTRDSPRRNTRGTPSKLSRADNFKVSPTHFLLAR